MPKNAGQDGQGTTKAIRSVEEQNATRRAAKQRQRHSTRKGFHSTPLSDEIRQDRFNQQAAQLLDTLDPLMTSSSKLDTIIIRAAFSTFMQAYVNVSQQRLREQDCNRVDYALDDALRGIESKPLTSWFRHTVKKSLIDLRRSNGTTEVNSDKELAAVS